MNALQADTYRHFGKSSRLALFKGVLLNESFRYLVTLRCCQAAHQALPIFRWILFPVARVCHGWASHLANVVVPWRTSMAPGVALPHARGIMINPCVQIGRNVTIFHGVTLGQRDQVDMHGFRTVGCPVIEDDVWIGPNAIIVGNVTIGRGCRIAGGAFVFETIPPYCLVMGNPGVIVRRDCSPDVVNRVD